MKKYPQLGPFASTSSMLIYGSAQSAVQAISVTARHHSFHTELQILSEALSQCFGVAETNLP